MSGAGIVREPSIWSFITSPPSLKRPAGPSATYASQAGKYGLWTSVWCVYIYKYGRNTDMNMGVWAFTRTYICVYTPYVFTGELCSPTRFSLAETLALAGTTGAGRMAPPTRTRISAKLKRVQGHSVPVDGFRIYGFDVSVFPRGLLPPKHCVTACHRSIPVLCRSNPAGAVHMWTSDAATIAQGTCSEFMCLAIFSLQRIGHEKQSGRNHVHSPVSAGQGCLGVGGGTCRRPTRPQYLSSFWHSHRYTLLIPDVGIVTEASMWSCIISAPSLKGPAGSGGTVHF